MNFLVFNVCFEYFAKYKKRFCFVLMKQENRNYFLRVSSHVQTKLMMKPNLKIPV